MKIIFVSVFALLVSSCASFTKGLVQDPEVKVLDFSITNLTMQDVAVNVKMNVKNPNPLPINLDKINYNLKFSGQQVTEGVFDQGVTIPASGENTVTVPLKFNYNSINSLMSGIFKNTFAKDYELTGSVKMGLFSIPFTQKGEVKFSK
jgi:LEA14-like dessication related protein